MSIRTRLSDISIPLSQVSSSKFQIHYNYLVTTFYKQNEQAVNHCWTLNDYFSKYVLKASNIR